MRPLLLATLATPLLHACAPTCTSEVLTTRLEALASDHSPADLPQQVGGMTAVSCRFDDLTARHLATAAGTVEPSDWAAACPAVPDPAVLDQAPVIANRRAVHAACNAAALGLTDEETFVTAGRNQALALVTAHLLRIQDKVDDATAAAVARGLLAPADLILPEADVPRLAVEEAVDPGAPHVEVHGDTMRVGRTSLDLGEVAGAPPAGDDGWAIQAVIDAARDLPDGRRVLAVDADTDATLLGRLVASVAGEAGEVTLLTMATVDGQDDRPHGVTLGTGLPEPAVTARPGPGVGWTLYVAGAPLPPREGCPVPGPTLCSDDRDALAEALVADAPSAVAPHGTAADIAALAARTPSLHLDRAMAPCLHGPPGMVCVPGGPTLAGDATHAPGDGPGLVTLSTYYLDSTEVTVGAWQACVDAGACEAVTQPDDPDLPADRLDFVRARAVCTFQGKRLPTEWEWEKAARRSAAAHPLAADERCGQAWHDGCGRDTPRHVAHHGPTPRLFYDLFGNVAEWTGTVAAHRGEACGTACEGVDPLGVCDGAPMCKGRLSRVVRGGGYRHPAEAASPTWREGLRKTSGRPGIGVRCASDSPVLDTFPPAWVQAPPPAPDLPPALSDEARAVLDAIAEDAIDEIPECTDGRRGSSRTDCKDPTHYIYPNEDRAHITYPYLVNRGGALLGVGSDQNYTFAAIARSELVFLMDYDAIVVHIHRVNQALVKHAETPEAFVALWDPANRDEALRIIGEEWAGDPMAATYERTLRSLNRVMHRHYTRTAGESEHGATSWLRDPDLYAWVRGLWQRGRIVSLKGDMLGPNAMQGVGAALRELGVPMRIYYTSNAPNAWGGEMTASYKRNVRSFPMDDDSVVLQALGWTNEFGQTGHWHFNVQDGLDAQDRLGRDGYVWLWQVVRPYRSTDDVDLTLSGLPGTWADSHPE